MHLEVNWPNRAEMICEQRGLPIELLNFSLDGVGLANWWSIVHNLLEREEYELDAIVFACFIDNLDRKFHFWDSRNSRRLACGRSASWDPATYPQTLEQASKRFSYPAMYIVDSDQYVELVRRRQSPFHLSLVQYIRTATWVFSTLLTKGDDFDDSHRLSLIHDLGEYVKRRNLQVFLLTIPSRAREYDATSVEALIGWKQQMPPETARDYERFCEITGAKLWDFTETYRGRSLAEVYEMWNLHDPHTSQKGSDVMANFVIERLSEDLLEKATQGP